MTPFTVMCLSLIHICYECKWATNTVVHILENREYMGCLVNFKTEKPSYKTKHSVENPIEKQAIFENHHEPIIDTQTWERVQELRKQRKRPNRYDEVGLFSGMLFCADCGSVMYQQRYQTDKRKQDCYICGNYKKRTHDCTAHFIRTDLLTAGVLSNLRKVTSYAAKHEARFIKLLICLLYTSVYIFPLLKIVKMELWRLRKFPKRKHKNFYGIIIRAILLHSQ